MVGAGALPIVAVERVEVIAGGAPAINGSNAVSGVVNLLRNEVEEVASRCWRLRSTGRQLVGTGRTDR
jgi:outer membrane receptor for ferrienterochelin and colicin